MYKRIPPALKCSSIKPVGYQLRITCSSSCRSGVNTNSVRSLSGNGASVAWIDSSRSMPLVSGGQTLEIAKSMEPGSRLRREIHGEIRLTRFTVLGDSKGGLGVHVGINFSRIWILKVEAKL